MAGLLEGKVAIITGAGGGLGGCHGAAQGAAGGAPRDAATAGKRRAGAVDGLLLHRAGRVSLCHAAILRRPPKKSQNPRTFSAQSRRLSAPGRY